MTKISKPYISAIETGRAANPPSEEKLRRLEKALQFAEGQLIRLARLERTPPAIVKELDELRAENRKLRTLLGGAKNLDEMYKSGKLAAMAGQQTTAEPDATAISPAYGIGPFGGKRGQIESGGWIPVINRLSAGYPTWHGDMDYPPGIADDYVRCPDCRDPNAFAARISGDSMEPNYLEGDIVVFSPAAQVNAGDDCFVRRAVTGETNFKRVFFEEDGRIRLQPRNEKYAPTVLPREEIDGLFKAIVRVAKL
jgi:phage repressor protein C with HTH and peptisase S24 domain